LALGLLGVPAGAVLGALAPPLLDVEALDAWALGPLDPAGLDVPGLDVPPLASAAGAGATAHRSAAATAISVLFASVRLIFFSAPTG
jgi:hypothetical protein